MNRKRAIITGIRGQDGQLLAQLLMQQNFEVIGTSHQWHGKINDAAQTIDVHQLDLGDDVQIQKIIKEYQPDELYCLAARASSADLFADPVNMTQINGLSCLRFLEAIRQFSPQTRICYASSSEVYAGCNTFPQSESTPTEPLNVYGIAKNFGMQFIGVYRQQFGLFATSAVLFNHESSLRPIHFVSKKICSAAAKISRGLQSELTLGDLTARRDWTYAGDTVRAMYLMLQAKDPSDFVISSGKLHSVAEMCDVAFSRVGLQYLDFVKSATQSGRRDERNVLFGDATKAKTVLGWAPIVSFVEMINDMVDHELQALSHL